MYRTYLKMNRSLILFGLALVLLSACTEFQERQLQQDIVEVFIPRDSLRTDIATQQFYWYEVEGAIDYEFQIAEPDFAGINRLITDTITTSTRINISLQPGEYEWRVRAFNNSSATSYTSRKLFIDSTLNLSNQELVLISPSDQDTFNDPNQNLEWQSLYNAESYDLDLAAGSSFGSILQTWTTTSPRQDVSLSTEGNYLWRVRARNSSSSSPYSSRSFYLDTTAPGQPILISPSNRQSLSASPINFQWQRQSVGVSSVRDSLIISQDSLFFQIHLNLSLSTNSFSIDTLSSGDYYWRVRTADKAGNLGAYSDTYRFTAP